MPAPNDVQAVNAIADEIIRKAKEDHPRNPVGILLVALMKAGRMAGMADADLAASLTDLQRRNPRPN